MTSQQEDIVFEEIASPSGVAGQGDAEATRRAAFVMEANEKAAAYSAHRHRWHAALEAEWALTHPADDEAGEGAAS